MSAVAAHLIVGARREWFLPAMLESIADAVGVLLVNDNSGEPDGPNARAIASSRLARDGRAVVDRAPFVDFAAMRNRVLDMHRSHGAAEWALFVDADDVHGPHLARIARNLAKLPPDVVRVDDFMLNFEQSFDWFTGISRRLMFARVTPALRWERPVHEQLVGARGRTVVVPYAYASYGWVAPAAHLAERGLQNTTLGEPPAFGLEAPALLAHPEVVYAGGRRRALRFRGAHAEPLARVRAELEAADAERFARADASVAAAQSPWDRLANGVRRVNFAQRRLVRWLDPQARMLMS